MAEGKGPKLTPMMRQYQGMKQSLPSDVLLLFRLGDFYELFFEDAREASRVLGVTLTKRNGIPMCGVPHHAAEGYIAKLVSHGHRVAIGEQASTPKPGKLVERRIAQVISAGTIDNLDLLDSKRANHLAAACRSGNLFGLAWVDLTTGDFRLEQIEEAQDLLDELARLAPAETLIPDEGAGLPDVPAAQPTDGYTFLHEHAEQALRDHFGVQSLDGFGCAGMEAAVGAAGAILHYLRHQMHRKVDHLLTLRPEFSRHHVLVDAASQANLELVESRSGRRHTLLHAMDRTATPMGARLLRQWVLHPLRDRDPLLARQAVVAAFVEEPWLLEKVRGMLDEIRDIQRVLSRLAQGSGNARELQVLAASLQPLPDLRETLASLAGAEDLDLVGSLRGRLADFSEQAGRILGALVDEPPVTLREGGLFRDGYLAALDDLRAAARDGREWIAELQRKEAERSGIKSLKVRYNNVFGYFIEVTKANLDRVPDDYVRRQTTAGGERFVTPALKEMEEKILGADERAMEMEYEAFLSLRDEVLQHLTPMQEAAAAVAETDCLAGLAETARQFGHVRPMLRDDTVLRIRDGRHPVLDQTLVEEKFVPNDTEVDGNGQRLLLITGPNMAGKSTYIRQVALITLMAQVGAFVPASSAEIGLVDRIFTRVGASDDLAKGQSTFMVEMNETALIVNNATGKSLVILDEIGRGTSTFDGLSIAWAVAEHLHDEVKARTLFATHYHEMTRLAQSRPGVRNYNVAVREWNDRIIFLRKIVEGAADRSYGIQVARLAGLPASVIDRAKNVLNHLESQSAAPKAKRAPRTKTKPGGEDDLPEAKDPQLGLFD